MMPSSSATTVFDIDGLRFSIFKFAFPERCYMCHIQFQKPNKFHHNKHYNFMLNPYVKSEKNSKVCLLCSSIRLL
jgi:hypothetical protein